MVYLDVEGKVLAVHEGPRDAEGFAKTGKKAAAFVELREKAGKGDAAARLDLLMLQLELGQVGDEEAGKQLKDLSKPTPEQQKRIEALRAGAAVKAVVATIRDEKSEIEAGKKFLEMRKAGRPEPPGDGEAQPYWICIMYYAEEKKDADTYEMALKALKARFGAVEEAKDFFKTAEQHLQELRTDKAEKK